MMKKLKPRVRHLLFFCLALFSFGQILAQYEQFADSYSILSTIAGKGEFDSDGVIGWEAEFEDGDALLAELTRPHFAMADSAGNVFIADKDAHGIRMVSPDGNIRTVAGTSVAGDNGDGPGTDCQLSSPNGLWVKWDGTVYILDLGNNKVRRLNTDGNLQTVFHDESGISLGRGIWVTKGEDSIFYASGSRIKLWTPEKGVEVFADGFSGLGNISQDRDGYLVLSDRTKNLVYRLSLDGSQKTIIAGNGTGFGGGDGYAAIETGLDGVRGIWFLEDNSYFLATHEGSQIWYVDVRDQIHLFLDGRDGDEYHSGDGEDYRTPGYKISEPRSVSVDYQGNVLICENDYGYIRKIKNDYTYFYTSAPVNITVPVVSVFPNPAGAETNILIKLKISTQIRVSILNSLGKEVLVAFNDYHPGGLLRIPLDVSALSSGIYFYRVKSANSTSGGKLIIE